MFGYKVISNSSPITFVEGVTYEVSGPTIPCINGFQFHDVPVDSIGFTMFNTTDKLAIVEALGDIKFKDSPNQVEKVLATNKIKIIRFITVEELKLEGKDNTYDVPSGKYHFQNSLLHNDDGPAIVYKNGRQEWYQNGKIHRDNGPARIESNGTQYWYQNGKIHRDGEPARIESNGTQYWYQNGNIHRDDGPAIIKSNGTKIWYQNGNIHRDGEPAIIYSNGREEWYQNGNIIGIKMERGGVNGSSIVSIHQMNHWY